MGNWPSNYKSPNSFSGFGGKVISNNFSEGGFGVTDAIMISGHRTVKALEDLYAIPTQILSSNKSNENTAPGWEKDSLGQIWYVQDEKNYYRLINYNNHGSSSGWEKIKILTQKEYEDINKETSSDISNLNQKITSIETNLNNLNTQIESISSNLDKLTKKIEELSGNINTLQDKAILKSTATGNTAKYLWSGNLDAFNNINTTQKTNDTTFIIIN